MLIKYASHHSWYKSTQENSLLHYGKNDQRRLRKTISLAEASEIRMEIRPADASFFEWFTPLYNQSISAKRNPQLHDIKQILTNEYPLAVGQFTLTLYEKDRPVGGCIFTDYGWYHSIAYRVYLPDWREAKAPASPALYGEYLLDKYSHEQQRKMLTHGRDRNPYGINSSIGLCIFKLAAGCAARTALTHEVRVLDTDTVHEDCLVLHLPEKKRKISEATLICTEATKDKYTQLFKYPDRLTINTIIRA
jgi:hypothetical protein